MKQGCKENFLVLKLLAVFVIHNGKNTKVANLNFQYCYTLI